MVKPTIFKLDITDPNETIKHFLQEKKVIGKNPQIKEGMDANKLYHFF